jgi:hypothetical protein
VIDYTIANRCGTKPSAPSREALHSVLNQDIADAYQRRILFATVLHMMPEFQNR